MRKIILFAASALLSVSLFGQSKITGSCQNGGTYPSCIGGEIVFSGSNYPPQVHVTVTNSSGKAIDDADYTTDGGILRFTENLSFAGTYTIAINGLTVLTVTTS
jgi:hypothetical protein